MPKRLIVSLAVVSGLLLAVSAWTASAQVGGRCKVYRMDGRVIEGDVKELADVYEVTIRPRMVVRIDKEDVFKIVPLEAEVSGAESGGRPVERLRPITDAEIERILGSEDIDFLFADVEPAPESMTPLDTNPDGRREMERITGHGKVFETDHFLLAYTTDDELARQLGGRLESVYRWCVRMMEMLDIPFKRPEYRLEAYLFGTFDEYNAYQTNVGFDEPGAIGFYYRVNNRSAFFDMNTWPPIATLHERLKEPSLDHRRRRYITNRIKRWVDHMNREVIQHEAGHHIHFNIGFFNPRSDINKWVSEGLTQMFETPPGKLGGSLGATNHYRLYQFRQMFGYPTRRFPNLRMFIIDRASWRGGASYPPAWALTHYLWKKKRAGYAEFMQSVALQEDDVPLTLTEKQKQFEDCFGPIDEDFERDFLKFINGIQLRRSALPPTGSSP
jgi:hypothetical protein